MGESASLLTPEITNIISGFAGDVVPTVLGLVGILVPVGLSLWAIGFGVNKGIGYLKSRANDGLK